MEKPHIIFSNQCQLRRVLAMLLMVAMTISLLSATAYAYDSTVENCTSTTTINCAPENSSHADKEKTAASLFAGGCGTESDPYQIATAKQLNRVRCYLDKHFILIGNIDLSSYESWEPIGTFQPLSDKPEDKEIPDPEVAFTGTFNGNGYTVSNLSIDQPEGMAMGLFGCAVGDEDNPSSISNLTVKNVDVTGNAFVGGVLGVQYLNGNLERLSLTGESNKVRGNANVGGITGGSLSNMKDCDAAADIVLRGDGANHAGILSGGLEDGSLLNCTATGTVTAEGDDRYGVGGLAGCVIEGEAVTNCHANGVTIIALGENNAMIGGLLGHTGASDAEHPTQVTGCSADDVTITVSNSTSQVGGLLGSGFYLEQYKEYYPTPTMYRIANCNTSGSITGGSEAIGSIAGHAYNSIVENCTSTMTINCVSEIPQVGKEETGVSTPKTGILVVAHGSDEDEWNQPVRDAVEGVDCPYPVELGFLEFVEGENIGTAVDSLEKQGVEHIIAVPIFVASASSHIEEIKYILGIPSSITEEEATEEGLEVVSHSAEIEMTSAMDDHPLVAEILGDRIATVSQQADQEIVVLVAHGTSEAEDLAVWKNNLASLGQQLKENYQFLDVDYGFVALGEPNARAVVEAQQAENPGASIIVMPVMLSEGTFTGTRIPEVLAGLTYVYPEEGQRSLLPHDKISQLIVARACDDMGVFADGNGTEESPYQIATPEQLERVRYYLDKDFVLTADIDLSGYENWEPIGTFDENIFGNGGQSDTAFSGTFDGNGHTVSNLTAAHQDLVGVGLFSAASSDAVIKNLTVENASVIGYMSTAGIIGLNCGSMENVALKGENAISGVNCIGGIIGGHGFGSVKNCTVEDVTINVLGDNDFSSGRIIQCDVAECGGLIIGGAFTGSVENCSARGEIIAEGNEPVGLGGIGGCLQCMTEISGNTATVTITTTQGGHAIGGLCGYAGMGDDGSGYDQDGNYNADLRTVAPPCEISNNIVNVTINAPGATHVGGLVGTGLYFYGMEDRFNVTDCTVTGTIIAGTDATSSYSVTIPGAVAGRAVGSNVDSCTFTDLTINGAVATNKVGANQLMYESADQYEREGDTDGGALLYGLTDTYQPLFKGATFNEEYSNYWHDYCAVIVGEDNAADTAAAMKASIGGTLYGPEAVAAYTENPESTQFYCGFTGDVATVIFNGSQISGYNANGEELFSHAYRYVSYEISTDETRFGFHIFESLDGNADEYKYFAMAPDTPDTTHHIEFRYGSDLDELLELYGGEYAYWMAAGIPTAAMSDPEETGIEEVIALFCLENMDYTAARTSGSLSQISDLVGTWDYYIDGQAQPDTLYFVVDANGKGRSYYMGQRVSDYQVFAYDNDGSSSTSSGIYVANSDELKWANYSITTNSTDKTIFTLTGEDEGQAFTISYIKRTSIMSPFAGGSGTVENPYQIATLEQLDKVRNYLDQHFILTADIDLSGYGNWEPIGIFQPLSDKPEDEETPDQEVAFTGTFNGNGYTISNLTIDQPEGMAVGLFGCTAGEENNSSSIYDLTVENVNVTGNFLVGGVVGYQASGYKLENVSLTGSNTIRSHQMVGGITGGTFGDIINCDAEADIVVLGDGGCWAGVLLGGQGNSVVNYCTAKGTVMAEGDNCWGLGGMAGCAGYDQGSEVINCHADVSITALGKNNTMIGGLMGFTGTFGDDVPSQITGCSANTTIEVSNSAERVGGLVGGSFYHELYADERPVPSSYAIADCSTSGSITGGSRVGSIAGYAYNSTVENCTSTLGWSCHGKLKQVGYF